MMSGVVYCFFFFKQKTAYEMRISDWSSDVCSSDLATQSTFGTLPDGRAVPAVMLSNANGVSATVIAYGATLQSVILPDKDGNKADVALGYDNQIGRASCRESVCQYV